MLRNFIRCFPIALMFVPVCAAGQSAPASNESATTIHANADLVVVDVVVVVLVVEDVLVVEVVLVVDVELFEVDVVLVLRGEVTLTV